VGGRFRGDVFFQAKIEGTALVLTGKRPPKPFEMSVGLKCKEQTLDASVMRKNLPQLYE